jgi:hypothetical protein
MSLALFISTNTRKKSCSFECFGIENPFLIEFHFHFFYIFELKTTAIFTTGEHEFRLKTALFLPLSGLWPRMKALTSQDEN